MASHAGSIVLGLDLATANARIAALCLDTGDVLTEHELALAPVTAPHPGWSEQEPSYAKVALKLISQAAAGLGSRAGQIGALSVTGTSGSIVPADAAGRPLGKTVLYNDQRSAEQDRRISELHLPGPTSALGRITWLCGNDDAERYLSTVDVVIAALAGTVLPSDTSHFLKAGIELENAAWPADALEVLGIAAETVPELVWPGTVIGTVAADIARQAGLPPEVRIIAGMSDGCTAQIASGAVNIGDAAGVLGTTLVLKSVAAVNVVSADKAVYSHRSPEGSFWPGGASNVGAGLLAQEFGPDPVSLQRFSAQAAGHGPAAAVRYPLARRGERFPHPSAAAEGFVHGGVPGDEVDLFRATLEGVAFVERLGLERLRALGVRDARYVVTGGASTNTLWNRIRATVLGFPVFRPRSHNSAFGAALLAGASLTGSTLSDTAARLVSIDERFDPLEQESEALEASFGRFKNQLIMRGYLEPQEAGPAPRAGT